MNVFKSFKTGLHRMTWLSSIYLTIMAIGVSSMAEKDVSVGFGWFVYFTVAFVGIVEWGRD